MRHFLIRCAIGVLVPFLVGCTPRAATGSSSAPAPRVSEIVDGTVVRMRTGEGEWTEGRSRGFGGASPIMIAKGGDTVAVTCAQELEMRDRTQDRGTTGALVGIVAGALATAISCGGQKYCGEENPTSLLATVIGYFVGREIRTVIFVPLDRIECIRPPADAPP